MKSKPSPKPLGASISVRVSPTIKDAFDKKALKYGVPSQVLREIISAFISDRLTIRADKTKESLYEH